MRKRQVGIIDREIIKEIVVVGNRIKEIINKFK